MYRSRFLARIMIDMEYSAVALGDMELGSSVRAVRADVDQGLPVICANLYHHDERVFPAAVVKRIKGWKVGIFALLGEEPPEMEELELRDPVNEGVIAVKELKDEGCDIIVLLAHMQREKLLTILPHLDDVDFIVRGHSVGDVAVAEDCADTLGGTFEDVGVAVLFAGNRGRSIGKVRLASVNGEEPVIVERKIIYLDRSIGEDQEVASRLRDFYREEGLRRREMQLSEVLSRDEVTGTIKERYLGIEICRRCHMNLMPRFLLSRHFRAFETLTLQEEEEDRRCLPCHTTGFGRFSGYDADAEKEGRINLRGVQCESCHGPGTKHSRDGRYRAVAERTCRECHTSKWSPDFSFEEYWKRAAHCGGDDSTRYREIH